MKLEDILSQVKEVEQKKLKEENTGSTDPRILVFKKGGRYTGRILPNLADVPNSFVTYEAVGFPSRNGTGEYVFAGRSPSNAGIAPKNDVLKQTQWNAYKAAKDRGDEPEMALACKLIPSRNQLVNFYLHSVSGDDKQAEKVGQVVVLKYPARLNKDKKPSSEIFKIIDEGLYGDKAGKIGQKAFDLSDKGRSLEIKVDASGEWNSYSASFDDAEDLGLTAAQQKEIYGSVHDLTEFVPTVKSDSELKQILDEHWFVKNSSKEDELDESETPDDDDDLDFSPSKGESSDDADDLLEGIDDL